MEKERLRAISKSLTQVLFYPDTNITISVYGFNQRSSFGTKSDHFPVMPEQAM